MKIWQTILGITCLTLALSACGGGGDDAGGSGTGGNTNVPESPTRTLSNSSDEAGVLAKGAVEGSGDNVAASRRQSQLDAFSRLGGAATGASSNGANGQALKVLAKMSERFIAKEVVQISCADLLAGNAGNPADEQIRDCSGSISFESNITEDSVDNAGTIAAGTFVTMTYNNLRFASTVDGSVSVNGTIRIDYLEDLVLNPLTGSLRYQAINLSGSSDGETFGPESNEYIISFRDSKVEVIADGVRLSEFDAQYTDTNNYTIVGGSVIDQIGDDYVQVDYSNWRVVGGIPQTGSRLTVVGTNGTATVEVTSNTGTIVAMTITIVAEGRTAVYDLQINITNGSVTII